jgi:hypothetical protein
MQPAKHMSQFPPGKVIADAAGLEPEYKNLQKKLKIEPLPKSPACRELLSPEQKSKQPKDEDSD